MASARQVISTVCAPWTSKTGPSAWYGFTVVRLQLVHLYIRCRGESEPRDSRAEDFRCAGTGRATDPIASAREGRLARGQPVVRWVVTNSEHGVFTRHRR